MCVNLIKPGKIIISCKIFRTVITWIWLIICVDFLIQLPGIFTIFFKSLGRFSKRIYLNITSILAGPSGQHCRCYCVVDVSRGQCFGAVSVQVKLIFEVPQGLSLAGTLNVSMLSLLFVL